MRCLWLIQTLVVSAMIAAKAYAQETPIEIVELEWASDVTTTKEVVEGDPIFIRFPRTDCPSGVTNLLKEATPFAKVRYDDGYPMVYVDVPIEADGIPCGFNPPGPPPGHERTISYLVGALPEGHWCIAPYGYDRDTPNRRYQLPGYRDVFQEQDCPTWVHVRAKNSALSAYHSGVWRDMGTEGEGIFLEVFESGSVFTYMGKGQLGGQLWLVSDVIPFDTRSGALMLLGEGTMNMPSGDIATWGELRYATSPDTQCQMKVEFWKDGERVKSMSLQKMASPRHQSQDC